MDYLCNQHRITVLVNILFSGIEFQSFKWTQSCRKAGVKVLAKGPGL